MKEEALYRSIGARIRELREESGLGLLATASQIGVGRDQYARFERGGVVPVWVLVKLADAFDCTLDDFVPLDADSEAA